METLRESPTQAEPTLSERLKSAFRRVSPMLRPDAKAAFCEFHRIQPKTFDKKLCGANITTEQEIEWMLAWRPAGMPLPVQPIQRIAA